LGVRLVSRLGRTLFPGLLGWTINVESCLRNITSSESLSKVNKEIRRMVFASEVPFYLMEQGKCTNKNMVGDDK